MTTTVEPKVFEAKNKLFLLLSTVHDAWLMIATAVYTCSIDSSSTF
jgi:hypothetical protein